MASTALALPAAQLKKQTGAHSQLAPSAAPRWSTCTASVGFIEENAHILSFGSSDEADEGTRAHTLADLMLKFVLKLERVKLGKADNDEMALHVKNYVAWATHDLKPGETIRAERKVPLFYKKEDNGTVDVTVFGMPHRLVIRDLKYGVGVSVDAEDNDQLALYAESVIQEWEEQNDAYVPATMPVTMEIFQPRDMHNAEPVRSWTIKRWELAKFVKRHREAVATIRSGKGVAFVPSSKGCRWCPAKGICKAYATVGLEVLNDEVTSVDTVLAEPRFELPNVLTLSREQRQRIIAGRKTLESWLEAVEDQEVHELLTGAPTMDYKLVEGKSNRQWRDEGKAIEILDFRTKLEKADFLTPSELRSVAQIEALFPGKELPDSLSELVFKPAGKPTLVPVADKRPALVINPSADFVDLDSPGSEYV